MIHELASSIHSARYLAPNYRAGPSYSPNRQGLGPRSPGMLPPTSERGAMFIPGSVYGPNVLQSTMARLNASRQMLEHAGRSIVEGFSSYFSPSGSSKLPGGYPYGYDPSMSHYYKYAIPFFPKPVGNALLTQSIFSVILMSLPWIPNKSMKR